MTTYAALLERTHDQLRAGHDLLRCDGFLSTEEARRALVDFHGLLEAVATHGRRLLTPAHGRRMTLDSRRPDLSPTEAATTRLLAAIERVVGGERPHPALAAIGTSPWARSAQTLRAATDLIAVQFDTLGRPRTPEAETAINDRNGFDTAQRDLALLTQVALADEETLALRAIQRAVPHAVVVRLLPGLTNVDAAARQVSTVSVGPTDSTSLNFAQTWDHVRTGEPVIELQDRLRRLRHRSWAMTTDSPRDDALLALRDLAVIGIAVHAHTAAFHGGRPMTGDQPAARHGTGVLIRRGRAWQTVHRHLSTMAVLTPGVTSTRDDLIGLSRLLPTIAPLSEDGVRAGSPQPVMRRIGAALNGAVATMAQIGEDNLATFTALTRTAPLYCLPNHFGRDVLSENADLANAQLRGGIATAPQMLLDAITTAYDDVRHHPVHTLTRTGDQALTPTGVEEAFDAIHRA